MFKITWGIYKIYGVSNLLGGCAVVFLGIIINGGKFGLGCIVIGRSLDGMWILKWKKFFDVTIEDNCLYITVYFFM